MKETAETPGDATLPVTPTRRPTVAALDEMIGVTLPVLDHGFVRLVDYMGDDQAIVQAARVSYGRGTKKAREDRGLVRYLLRHHHTTPFEMCEIKVHVKLPIFVARQWIRHRTACLTGDTRLYFDLPNAVKRGGRSRRAVSLDRLHRLWHEGTLSGQARIRNARLRMCDELSGGIRHTRITDIWSTGTKPVFRVTLENGYALTMTKDHRCLTQSGWMTLESAAGLSRSTDGAVTWRAQAPAFAVNGVPAVRDEQWLTARRAEGLDQGAIATRARRRLVRTWSRIASIEYAGEQPTYDVAVEGPYHNFVANGFVVHNSVNEYSGRYSILDREFYVPAKEILATQSAANRQGRGDTVSPKRAAHVLDLLKGDAERAYAHYEDMLGGSAETLKTGEERGEEHEGIARELARINLPVSFYTQWYWKIDLHNLLRFIALRADAHAQYEIRVYAEALAALTQKWVPDVYEAFVDYQLEAAALSRMELEALRSLLRGEQPDLAALGLSAREQAEFKQRFGLA